MTYSKQYYRDGTTASYSIHFSMELYLAKIEGKFRYHNCKNIDFILPIDKESLKDFAENEADLDKFSLVVYKNGMSSVGILSSSLLIFERPFHFSDSVIPFELTPRGEAYLDPAGIQKSLKTVIIDEKQYFSAVKEQVVFYNHLIGAEITLNTPENYCIGVEQMEN